MIRHAVEFWQEHLCKTPARLDTIDMPLTTVELITIMVNPEVFIKADVDKSIITAPSIGTNHSIWPHMSTNNGLQCCFRTIWNDRCTHFTLAFQNAESDYFVANPQASFFPNSLRAKIRFIDLYRPLQRRLKLAAMGIRCRTSS